MNCRLLVPLGPVFIAFSLLSTISAAPAEVAATLRDDLQPALQRNDWTTAENALSDVLKNTELSEVDAVNDLLQQMELPQVAEILFEVRLRQVLSMGKPTSERMRHEARTILPQLNRYVSATFDAIQKLCIRESRTSASLQDYSQRRWGFVVASNQLSAIPQLVRYRDSLLKPGTGPATKLADRAKQLQLRLDNARFKWRHENIMLASKTLRHSTDFKERLRAAFVISVDGTQVLRHLQTSRVTSNDQKQLLQSVRTQVKLANDLAGNLLQKSQYLHGGMYWWLRGRHGEGTRSRGLTKQQDSIASARSQFPLFMPLDFFNSAKTTTQAVSSRPISRRHHYLWQTNLTLPANQSIGSTSEGNSAPTTSDDFSLRRITDLFYCRQDEALWALTPPSLNTTSDEIEVLTSRLSSHDAAVARCAVGFVEYEMSLRYFNALLQRTTEQERQMIDELIVEQKSFRLTTNLSKGLSTAQSQLGKGNQYLGQQVQHHGLAWTVALARLEVGAILATFTTASNPFARTRPSSYEMPAYRALLVDAARTHYWSLKNDPSLASMLNEVPRSQTFLAYAQRADLAKSLVRAVTKTGVGYLTPDQFRELATWNKDLTKMFDQAP